MLNKLTDKEFASVQKKFREKQDDYNIFVFLLDQEEKRKNKLKLIPSFLEKLFSKIKSFMC